MKKIKALSWDQEFKDYVEKSSNYERIGSVHSVFDKVFNIEKDAQTLYTVSNHQIDGGPYTLKTQNYEPFKKRIKDGTAVFKKNDSLRIGTLEITLADPQIKSFEIKEVKDYSKETIRNNIQLFNTLIKEEGNPGGCLYYYEEVILGLERKGSLMERELMKRIQNFQTAIEKNQLTEKEVNALIGFGMGLTPSGDDFLTAFMTSLSLFSENETLLDKVKDFIQPFLSNTTRVSASMLEVAIEGKAREYLMTFTQAFLKDDDESFKKALEDLLTIGSSSGTDMSVGIILAFEFFLKDQKNRRSN